MKNIEQSIDLKLGVGLRPTHFAYFDQLDHLKSEIKVDFFEAIVENFLHTRGRPFTFLEKVMAEFPIAFHGVSLNIVGTDEIDFSYLEKVKELYTIVNPILTSDHLCWTGENFNNIHNLLPFAYTTENLKHVVERVKRVQDFLDRRMLFENLSAYLSLHSSTMSEIEFLNELCAQTGCGILLDLNNLYVNSINQKRSYKKDLETVNLKAVSQIHLAGHTNFGDYLFDTHSAPVCQEVWEILKIFLQSQMQLGKSLHVLVEWDDAIPEFSELQAEALKVKQYL